MQRVREAVPYGSAPAVTCSAKPGADVESHQLQFLESQGPVARIEPRKTTQILRAGSAAKPSKYASPRNGVLGDGRHGGRGGAAASADCARPLASFGSFSTWKRNSPRRAKPWTIGRRGRAPALHSSSNDACFSDCPPHPPQCAHWGTFPYPLCRCATSPLDKGSRPPRGRLKKSGRRGLVHALSDQLLSK